MRRWIVLLTAVMLAAGICLPCAAETERSEFIEAAFRMLEEGNPFAARYGQLTGQAVEPLFPEGVPYFFGGIAKPSGNGYFYMSYPDYYVKQSTKSSGYFRKGEYYCYGVDCGGFARYVYLACRSMTLPSLNDMMTEWSQRQFHLYDNREGHEAPPYTELKDVLRAGDLLVVKHEGSGNRHIMMYIGTLRDFGYTAEEEPALAAWMDCPLVIHCGLNPVYGERFRRLFEKYPDKYGKCTTTDGGVAVSILGPAPSDAPEHGHVQQTDFDWFEMNDGGYILTVIDLADVKQYCWYRP